MKLLVLALLPVLLFWTGAAVTPPDPPEPPSASSPDADPAVPFRIVPPPYPQAVEAALQEVHRSGGYRLVRTPSAAFLVIGLGERPTGGYGLDVRQVTRRTDGSVLVIVRERKPAPGSLTTQALTYPTAVLALPAEVTAVAVEFAPTP